jgi:peptide/nickel transport system substrate-binding protein
VRLQLTIDMIPGTPDYSNKIAEYAKPQLKKVGIDVTLRASPDFPSWARRVSNQEFDLTTDSVWNWGDPVIGVHRTYLSSNIRKGVIWSNTQSYKNPRVDDLLTRAGTELDLAKRKALYAEFQKIVVDECPQVFLSNLATYIVADKKITGLPKSIWNFMTPLTTLSAA